MLVVKLNQRRLHMFLSDSVPQRPLHKPERKSQNTIIHLFSSCRLHLQRFVCESLCLRGMIKLLIFTFCGNVSRRTTSVESWKHLWRSKTLLNNKSNTAVWRQTTRANRRVTNKLLQSWMSLMGRLMSAGKFKNSKNLVSNVNFSNSGLTWRQKKHPPQRAFGSCYDTQIWSMMCTDFTDEGIKHRKYRRKKDGWN